MSIEDRIKDRAAAEKRRQALEVISSMARDGEWLCADACAFLLGMVTPSGEVNRRGFLERVAVRSSSPPPGHRRGEEMASDGGHPMDRGREKYSVAVIAGFSTLETLRRQFGRPRPKEGPMAKPAADHASGPDEAARKVTLAENLLVLAVALLAEERGISLEQARDQLWGLGPSSSLDTAPASRLLRVKAIVAKIGMSQATIYRWISEGQFPKPVKIGSMSVWHEADIDSWMDQWKRNRG